MKRSGHKYRREKECKHGSNYSKLLEHAFRCARQNTVTDIVISVFCNDHRYDLCVDECRKKQEQYM